MRTMKEQEDDITHEKVGRSVCSWMGGALVRASGEPSLALPLTCSLVLEFI